MEPVFHCSPCEDLSVALLAQASARSELWDIGAGRQACCRTSGGLAELAQLRTLSEHRVCTSCYAGLDQRCRFSSRTARRSSSLRGKSAADDNRHLLMSKAKVVKGLQSFRKDSLHLQDCRLTQASACAAVLLVPSCDHSSKLEGHARRNLRQGRWSNGQGRGNEKDGRPARVERCS